MMTVTNRRESVLSVELKTLGKRRTVEIVDISSNQLVTTARQAMADDKTFDDHVDDVRESNDTEIDERIERLEEKANQRDVEPVYSRLSTKQKWIVGAVAMLLIGITGAAANPTQPLFGFIVLASTTGIVLWVTITKSGIAFRESISDELEDSSQQQQQRISTGQSQENTVVCQNCGWKNPNKNNYCHDCGNEI